MNFWHWSVYRMKLYVRDILSFLYFPVVLLSELFTSARKRGLRILVYHSIQEIDPQTDTLRMSVSPGLFEKQIKCLISWGYKVVTLDDAVSLLAGKGKVYGNEIVLTFDDGFEDNSTEALGLLKSHGLKAVFFLIANGLNGNRELPEMRALESTYGRHMDQKSACKLINEQMTVGSHTLNHKNLGRDNLSQKLLQEEIRLSKQKLENLLNTPVKYFAYPFGCKGSFNKITEEEVRKSGYAAACTNIFGTNRQGENPFTLKRTRITWNDTPLKFRIKLKGAYDWVDRLQARV
mgnify:FL=1